MIKLIDRLQSSLVMGDGAIGTLLYQRGQPVNGCYEALNLSAPELISRLHIDYLEAGAEIIETNSFGANRHKLDKFNLQNSVEEINKKAVRLAREASRGRGYVAASVGPVGNEQLSPVTKKAIYLEHLEALLSENPDALFFETFNKAHELSNVIKLARSLTALPIIGSLSFSDDGHTVDGLRINAAFDLLREAGASVTGLNCHFGPTTAETILQELELKEGHIISVYPNAGRPEFLDGRYIFHPIPRYFAEMTPRLVKQGARLLGGCCGTTPETIHAIAQVIRHLEPVRTKKASVRVLVHESYPRENRNECVKSLTELWKEKLVIVTELDPPKTLSLDKMLEGSAALKEAGNDFITLADNSLAILRVSNLAAAELIRRYSGAECILHLACRDKNLLGLQSELMGLGSLGIDHVLALTGDPAKVGDHPGATSVYDLNSVGLIKTIKRLNEGVAANGRDLKGKTNFTIGCALNPNARNLDSQVRKLEDKIKAGAQFVMTQPIFDPSLVEITFEKTKHLNIPILMGVMPLLNGRNTEFLHHEVPGIVIPDFIRERMKGLEGTEGNEAGLEVARRLCDAVLQRFNGIYLITPLMRYDLTVQLTQYCRSLKPAASTN
ncbi:MAG: metF [Verrucomicrobiales bacterium]|nr:metF [Verrucomicrobiales bacterium]